MRILLGGCPNLKKNGMPDIPYILGQTVDAGSKPT